MFQINAQNRPQIPKAHPVFSPENFHKEKFEVKGNNINWVHVKHEVRILHAILLLARAFIFTNFTNFI